ncbi:hypothetical protein EAE96_009395 [Botrytis aclada]|nr:hypothetical protein EAE96_009395 [Botrytis aclada]
MSQVYIGDRIVMVEEKRLEPFLPEPTAEFRRLLEDAQTQKLHCLEKYYVEGFEDHVEFKRKFDVLGTSGNVYFVTIGKKPSCNCFDGRSDILCVHIVFILTQFLNLPAPLRHQSAFLEAELRGMMGYEIDWMAPLSTDKFCTRKSVEEQEICPICCESLEGSGTITWCRGQCGKNFHLDCIWNWAQTNFDSEQPDLTCPNCRAPWVWIDCQLREFIEEMSNWKLGIRYKEAGYRFWNELTSRDVSKEGYFNVAELLGIDRTVEDDAEVHEILRRSWQRDVDRWRVKMATRPTILSEGVNNFLEFYYPELMDYLRNKLFSESNDFNSPRANRTRNAMDVTEMNVRRALLGFPVIETDSPWPYTDETIM